MSDHALNTVSGPAVAIPQAPFSGWHPLQSGWLEELAPEMQKIARQAQQYLFNNKRTDQELAVALTQIKTWREAHRQLISENAPELIFDENLGSQLEPYAFIRFLLAQESSLPLKPYEFVALALLQEISGRAELDVVAKKSAFSLASQHITLKIGRLHTATALLGMMDDPSLRGAAQTILDALLKAENA